VPAIANTPRAGLGGRGLAACAVALAALAFAPRAEAQRLPDNGYAIDLFQGPVLAPIRVIGIAGAYAGYAEGIPGFVANAASPALREPFSVDEVEWDIAASISIPISLFDNNDFDNSGDRDDDYSNFLYLTGGAIVQVGHLGFGGISELQRYTVEVDDERTYVTVGRHHLLGALRLAGDQVMLGAGARVLTLGVEAPEAALTFASAAPEVGFLVRPRFQSFRLGATFRAPVKAPRALGDVRSIEGGVEKAGGLVLPAHAEWPWEIEAGIAVQVGPRPLNPEWLDPGDQERELAATRRRARAERAKARDAELVLLVDPAAREARARELEADEAARRRDEDALERRASKALRDERRARYKNWPREQLLVTAELLVSGAVDDGVSLAAFLGQNEAGGATARLAGTSGASVSYSPRFGVETEPILGHVHTRFGSYYEPSRFERTGRQHFTFGADLRAFTTTWFGLVPEVTYKLQASADIAPRYESYSAGIGVWH
jgi:hypothetical protein